MLRLFIPIVMTMVLGDVAWWLWADARLRRTRRASVWRPLLGLFSGLLLGYLLWFIVFPNQGRHAHLWVPMPILAAIYLWHLLVLPAVLIGILIWGMIGGIGRLRARRKPKSQIIEDVTDL